MLQRAAHLIFPSLSRATEAGVVTASCRPTRCRWRRIENSYVERGLHSGLRAMHKLNTCHQKAWQRQSFRHHHFPFTTEKMSAVPLLQATISPQMSPLPLWAFPETAFKECHVRLYSTKPTPMHSASLDENQNQIKVREAAGEKGRSDTETGQVVDKDRDKEDKLTLVQKFKLMYKQYWYVLLPVHMVTSIVWYGSFFIAAKSGVDIVPLMEKLGAGEKILSHLQNSNTGYYAIAYAMYKIATPARYTITIGGTTISINYLKKRGYIKPVPSPEKLKEMYEGKREEFIEKKEEIVEKYQEKRDEIVDRYQERKEEIVEKYQERKEEIVEKYQERKEEIVEKYQERKEEIVEKYQEKREELRDKVAEKKEELKDKMEERKEKLEQVRDSIRKQR